MYFIAFVLLLLWSLVGAFDAMYFHDKEHSLHFNVTCFKEHLFHTIRAICYPIIVFTLFYDNFTGVIISIGFIAICIDTIFFILDSIEEKNSRNIFGGLSHEEYITHLLSSTLHYCAITTILLGKYYLPIQTIYPSYLSNSALLLTLGGTLTAIQHLCRLYKYKL